jgi:hypothetical protein
MELELNNNTNLKELHESAQAILDGMASAYCYFGSYEELKNASVEDRLKIFEAFKNMPVVDRLKIFREEKLRTIDLVESPNISHVALFGNHDDQVALKESLYQNGYPKVDLIEREEASRRITAVSLGNSYFLFSRDRILWKCQRDDGSFDYVVKKSNFIGDEDFIRKLDVDLSFPALSDARTLACEALLDESDDLVEPHSVKYFISSEMPDNIKPLFSKEEMKGSFAKQREIEESMQRLRPQTPQAPKNVLHINRLY